MCSQSRGWGGGIPTGWQSFSPRLRGNELPWEISKIPTNPERVGASARLVQAALIQPFQGCLSRYGGDPG